MCIFQPGHLIDSGVTIDVKSGHHPDVKQKLHILGAMVIALFARNVAGWPMKPTLSRELALDALMMGVWHRKPDGEVIVHSEQSS